MSHEPFTPAFFNAASAGHYPAHVGIEVTSVGVGELTAEFAVTKTLLAPNGYLHAGAVVTLADSCAGYGCVANLPEGASGFTTIELKSNHIGTVREGVVECVARAVHLGSTTQVWDATVSCQSTGKAIAYFRCTQMVLRPSE